MPREFEPLNVGPEVISPTRRAWLATIVRPGLTRNAAMANVLTCVQNKAGTYCVYSSYELSDKGLFDGEPERVVKELENRWSDFFDGLPCRNTVSETIKRAFIGEWCRTYIGLGMRRFGKPGLRKTESDVEAVY